MVRQLSAEIPRSMGHVSKHGIFEGTIEKKDVFQVVCTNMHIVLPIVDFFVAIINIG